MCSLSATGCCARCRVDGETPHDVPIVGGVRVSKVVDGGEASPARPESVLVASPHGAVRSSRLPESSAVFSSDGSPTVFSRGAAPRDGTGGGSPPSALVRPWSAFGAIRTNAASLIFLQSSNTSFRRPPQCINRFQTAWGSSKRSFVVSRGCWRRTLHSPCHKRTNAVLHEHQICTM